MFGLALCALGCDDATKAEPEAKSASKAAKTEAKAEKSGTKDAPVKGSEAKGSEAKGAEAKGSEAKGSEDKGSAKLKLGDKDWTAERARARIRDGKGLKITASRTTRADGKVASQRLTLQISDFKGPGDYVIGGYASSFAGAGLDEAEVKAAEGDDAKTTKAATDAIKKGSVVLLTGAKVKIGAVSDTFIDGSFTWAGATAVRGPTKVSGEFHARIKE